MATTDMPALADSTNAPPPRPAADKPPRAVVTWYHPDQLPPPPAAELLRPAPPAAPPKEPKSGFVFFGRATREEIKAAHPDWSLGDVGRELGKRWKALDAAAKKPFLDLAAADKERYEREKADYEAANPPAPVVVAKSVPPAPAPRKAPARKPVLVLRPLPEGRSWTPQNGGFEYVDPLTGLPPPKQQKKKPAAKKKRPVPKEVAAKEEAAKDAPKKMKKRAAPKKVDERDDIDARGRSRKERRLSLSDPRARGPRGPEGQWPIDPAETAEYIPRLQKHLKTLPGGEAMAKKVAGWGVFRDGGRHTCYVDPVANNGKGKCYRSKPKVVAALAAEASA